MAMFNLPRPVRCCLVVLLAPVVMGAAKFNYGMEIRDEDHVRSTFVYGVSRADPVSYTHLTLPTSDLV